MKNTLTLFLFLLNFSVYAQFGLEWVKSMEGGNSGGEFIKVDASGNVYTTGRFTGTADFDPGVAVFNLTSAGSIDIFISKLDVSGNFVWAKSMGGTSADAAGAIAIDSLENLYIVGSFNGVSDFDPGPGIFNLTSVDADNIFISKLDALGNFVWAKSTEGAFGGWASSVVLDASGNIYTTGCFYGTTDFDPGIGVFNLTPFGSFPDLFNDIFVLKLDANGDFLWAKQMGGSSFDLAYSIAADGSGNAYIAGHFRGIADFDPGTAIFNLSTNTLGDVFILKLDASGNFVFAKQIGGANGEAANSIGLDAFDNIYTIGGFQDTVDFDPGPGVSNLISLGSSDVFFSKLDSSGNFLWAKRIGGSSTIYGYSSTVDPLGNIYTTGYISETVDFDTGSGIFNLTPSGGANTFISKLDASGNLVWATNMGGDHNSGSSIDLDVLGNVYTSGFFNGIVDFDPGSGIFNLTAAGINDIFVHKMSQTTVGIKDNSNMNTVAVYPNPSSGIFSVNLHNFRGAKICVYDVLGNCLLNKDCRNDLSPKIDLGCQPKGIYFMEIMFEGERAIKKIVLQ